MSGTLLLFLYVVFLWAPVYCLELENILELEDEWIEKPEKEDTSGTFTGVTHRRKEGRMKKKRQHSHQRRRVKVLKAIERDKEFLNAKMPLKQSEPPVMFWRPQKVGSSTILGILYSYGFRYNAFPRRRATKVKNDVCRQISICALEKLMKEDGALLGKRKTSSRSYRNALISYTMDGGLNSAKMSESKQRALMDKVPPQNRIALFKKESGIVERVHFKMSTQHQCCNISRAFVRDGLMCALNPGSGDSPSRVKELFLVREPINRALSIYYFWGYLLNRQILSARADMQRATNIPSSLRLDPGKINDLAIRGDFLSASVPEKIVAKRRDVFSRKMYDYHGNGTTVPPLDIALSYARKYPLREGFPGPSLMWSVIADGIQSAVDTIESDDLMTLVVEKLDESLIVASTFLGWSLADVVYVKTRKSISMHPKQNKWPSKSIGILQQSTKTLGESAVYEASVKKLDERIRKLKSSGIDVKEKVALYRRIKRRVSGYCLTESVLKTYSGFMSSRGYKVQDMVANKLMDVEQKYLINGNVFRINGELIYAFDVCGPCEAHAILHFIENQKPTDIDKAPFIAEMDQSDLANNVNFKNCPTTEFVKNSTYI